MTLTPWPWTGSDQPGGLGNKLTQDRQDFLYTDTTTNNFTTVAPLFKPKNLSDQISISWKVNFMISGVKM